MGSYQVLAVANKACTFMYKFLCENTFSFLWAMCLRVQMLGYLAHLFLVLNGTTKLRAAIPFYILTSNLTLHLYLPFGVVTIIFYLAILIGV